MFNCELCKFTTNRSIDMTRHKETKKHITRSYEFKMENKNNASGHITVFQNGKNTDKTSTPTLKTSDQINKLAENFTQKPLNVFQNGDDDICPQIDNLKICQSIAVEKTPKKKSQTGGNNKIVTEDLNKDYDNIYNDTCEPCKKHICGCNKEYSTRQNLWKHQQKCNHKDTTNEINELKLTVTKLNATILEMQMIIDELRTNQNAMANNNILTNNDSNNLTNSNNVVGSNIQNNNQKIVNVYQYISSNFDDAPNITMLGTKDVNKLLKVDKKSKHSIEDLLVFYHRKYKLDSFLGEIIKTAYKKEDPEEQQFWTSNIKKLTFIVRQIINKTDKAWLRDEGGTCLVKHIINPILKQIKKLLQIYIDKLSENDESKSLEELEKSQIMGMHAAKIICDIDNEILQSQVLKYIAPYFQLEQTKLLE